MANLEAAPTTESSSELSQLNVVLAAIMRIEDELKKRKPRESLIDTSDETDKIDPAFIKAVPEFEAIHAANKANIQGKDGKAGYSYTYADLGDLLRAVRPALGRNGLGIVQAFLTAESGKIVTVETKIIHESSQFYRTRATMTNSDMTPQGIGKIITYGRRYQLLALLGIAPEEDDDGASGSGKTQQRERAQRPPAQQPRVGEGQQGTGQRREPAAVDPDAKIADKMAHDIRERLRALNYDEEQTVLALTSNVKKLVGDLNFPEANKLLVTLQQEKRKREELAKTTK